MKALKKTLIRDTIGMHVEIMKVDTFWFFKLFFKTPANRNGLKWLQTCVGFYLDSI